MQQIIALLARYFLEDDVSSWEWRAVTFPWACERSFGNLRPNSVASSSLMGFMEPVVTPGDVASRQRVHFLVVRRHALEEHAVLGHQVRPVFFSK